MSSQSFVESGNSPPSSRQIVQPAVPTASEPAPPKAFSIQQASVYTSCAVWYLRTAVWGGKLRARLAGKRFVFLGEDLDEFLLSLPVVRRGPYVRRKKSAAVSVTVSAKPVRS